MTWTRSKAKKDRRHSKGFLQIQYIKLGRRLSMYMQIGIEEERKGEEKSEGVSRWGKWVATKVN